MTTPREVPEDQNGPRELPRPSSQPLTLVLLALLLAFSLFHYAYDCVFRAWIGEKIDFQTYYAAALTIRDGGDIYDCSQLKQQLPRPRYGRFSGYPPFFAILMVPFTLLPVDAATGLWFVLNHLFILLSAVLLARAIGNLTYTTGLLLFALAANLFAFHFDLDLGQSNILMLLLIALGLCLANNGHPLWAGFSLGVATLTKLEPFLLVLFCLWRRRFRTAGAALVTIALLMGLSVAHSGAEVHRSWAADVLPHLSNVSGFAHDEGDSAADHTKHGLNSLFARLLVANRTTRPLTEAPVLAKALTWLSCGLVLAVSLFVCKPDRLKSKRLFALEFGLMVTTLLIVSPKCVEHHLVLLLIPYFLLFGRLARNPSRHTAALAVAVLSFVLCGAEYPYYHESFRSGLLVLLMSARLYGMVMLWGLLIYFVGSERRSLSRG